MQRVRMAHAVSESERAARAIRTRRTGGCQRPGQGLDSRPGLSRLRGGKHV